MTEPRRCPDCNRVLYRAHNSTIYKKCPNCELKKYVKREHKLAPRKKQTKSARSRAMANADTWFSRYIRIKYNHIIATDGTVLNKCIITGLVKEANKMDNGHCFSRIYLPTRYEEDNCRPQNRSSNRFQGEADHYTFVDNLIEQIGQERFDRLDKLRRENGEDTISFYQSKSDKYRKLTNSLISELGAKRWW